MRSEQLCMGCMDPLAGDAPECPNCRWREGTPPDSPLHLGARTVLLDQYLLGRVLGHGGFGITYLAWDLNLECKLAVKEYLPTGVATRASNQPTVAPYSGQSRNDFEWGLEKFLEEARVLARFKQQPGIASVLNFFRGNGTAYLVMEYLEGITLAEHLQKAGERIPYEEAVRLLNPVMDALREVHRAGILHRDISPDNVYLTRSGPVKLLDFGAARYALGQQSRNLSVILKEGYAPEEQYRTKGNQGPWTDVYALAATLYRCITGQVPVPALDRLELDELAPPRALGVMIPADAEMSLKKALAVRAADRYQSVEDFQAALANTGKTRVLTRPLRPAPQPVPLPGKAGAPPAVPPPSPLPGPQPMDLVLESVKTLWRRTPKQVAIAAAALIVLLFFWALERKPAPAHEASNTIPPARESSVVNPPAPDTAPGAGQVPSSPLPDRRETGPGSDVSREDRPGMAPIEPPGAKFSGPPIIEEFAVQPAQIRPGQTANVKWVTKGATRATIDPEIGGVDPQRNQTVVRPRQTQTYHLIAEGPGGTTRRDVTVVVSGEKFQPRVLAFQANPQRIRPGQSTTLEWTIADARTVELLPVFGTVEASGQRVVSPPHTTQYTIIGRPDAGPMVQQSVTVEVVGDSPRGGGDSSFGAPPERTAPQERSAPPERTAPQERSAPPASPGPTGAATPNNLVNQKPARELIFLVIHDHEGAAGLANTGLSRIGIHRNQRGDDFCSGQLIIQGTKIVLQAGAGHSFSRPLADIMEVRTNRLAVQGHPAFHVRFKDGDNFNFGAQSGDAAGIVNTINALVRAQ